MSEELAISLRGVSKCFKRYDRLLYLGIHDRQLRYFDVHGQLVPTLQEFNRLEIQCTQLERQGANALALEVDRLRQQVQGQSDGNE